MYQPIVSIQLRLTNLILKNRKVAYAITDDTLNVLEIGGEIELLPLASGNGVGHSLSELAPEIVGCEAEIAAVLRGDLPSFVLSVVNRESAQAKLLYVNLTQVPNYDEAGQINGL